MVLHPVVESLADGTGVWVRLPGGRRVGVRETGDAHGWPLFLFPGTPASRLLPLPDTEATREAGARVFVLERPGFGVSDPQPGRRILDWPADVAAVADALGVGSFAIAGMSAAGPYLAACAFALPERVRVVGMMGVVCPIDAPGIRRAMTPRRRLMYAALPLAPRVLPILRLMGPAGVRWVMSADVPECDRHVIARIGEPFAAMKREAFRQGPDAFARDLALVARPWGFRLEDVRATVYLWHGELDVSTPPAMGRYLAATLPRCQARFVADQGHFVAYAMWAAILRTLAPREGHTARA